jgi:hypothetical protein
VSPESSIGKTLQNSSVVLACKTSAIFISTLAETSLYGWIDWIPLIVSIKQLISLPIRVFSISTAIYLTLAELLRSSVINICLKMWVLFCKYFFMYWAFELAFKKFRIDKLREYFSLSSSSISVIRAKLRCRIFKASLIVCSPYFV